MYRKDMRPEIVDSFIEEFNIHGPKLTLDSVSARIHISKKTIYRFFRCKEDIYKYILKDAAKQIGEYRKSIYENDSMGLVDKLRAMLTIKTTWDEKIDLSKAFLLRAENPDIFTEVLVAYQDSWAYLEKLVAQGIEEGKVRSDVHPKLLANFVRASVQSLLCGSVLADTGITYGEAIDRMANLILDGILSK